MKAVVDPEGSIVVPSEMLESVGIAPGSTVNLTVRDGTIVLQAESVDYRLVKKGFLTVLQPTAPVPPLPEDYFEKLLDQMRREREAIEWRRAVVRP